MAASSERGASYETAAASDCIRTFPRRLRRRRLEERHDDHHAAAGGEEDGSYEEVVLELPPPKAVGLGGEADPAFGAAERARERRARELGVIVRLREVRADDVLQLRAVDRREDALGLAVVEVAERSGDAFLEPARVAAVP